MASGGGFAIGISPLTLPPCNGYRATIMRLHLLRLTVICTGIALGVGCRTYAPIAVWTPPGLQSTVGKRVAVSQVVGPAEIAKQVQQKLIASAPHDQGREFELVDSETLQPKSPIRLVAATEDQSSDVALASVARREGYDYILRGEVLSERTHGVRPTDPDLLAISWRLTAIDAHQASAGTPVVVERSTAIERYPELALLSDPDEQLVAAAVRETHRLFSPSLAHQRVSLAVPLLTPGRADVRRGNAAAKQGDWQQATTYWTRAAEQHPMQAAATHNLALAAAASQDFSLAKQLARKAVRQYPLPMYQQTLVWIEQTQRQYHEAFNLPDPPEGWFLTRS
ncbi:Tetratricopeptide repeat protein [Novipirellula galeiformis]|uniref:Tetratricopeptide repeat protein n=2 Tax=Novipirellula galeiformis TaxID=2528004 RepID=A0A5C6CRU6_9BACT|nr:Tetratricopeptide repeat protein [Novipirellula galeiformis]